MSEPSEREPLPPPPVEPLPDLAWARLERQLWHSLDAPGAEPVAARGPLGRWRYPLVAAVAVAAAAVLAIAWPRDPASRATLGAPALAVHPSRIVTADAPTEVSFGDAEIIVAPRTTLLLGGDELRGVELYLERGQATFEVAPRADRPPYVVRAGSVRVTVVGTAFTVARDGDQVAVDVTHGVVEIVAGGALTLVGAGQRWDREPVIADGVASAARAKLAFEAAAALEARDPSAAIAAYLRLAAGDGPWSANAQYAAARLAFDRGDRKTAGELARGYLTRFPEGANVVDARGLLARL